MNLESADRILAAGSKTIESLVSGLSDDDARWRPDPKSWSILEVVNHLYDEERGDFRARIQSTLADPQASWEPIDPDGWVTERDYNGREFAPSIENFSKERQKSIEWLQSAGKLDLEAAHIHPVIGALRVGDLLLSWLVHDQLHIRQLTKLHYLRLLAAGDPYIALYAGEW